MATRRKRGAWSGVSAQRRPSFVRDGLAVLVLALVATQLGQLDSVLFHLKISLVHRLLPPPRDGAIQVQMIVTLAAVHTALLLIVLLLASRIALRPLRDLGVSLRPHQMARGAGTGVALILLAAAGMAATYGVELTSTGAPLPMEIAWLFGWAVAMLLLATAEEMTFRTALVLLPANWMPKAIGIVLGAGLFTWAHAGNEGETTLGLLTVAAFAVVTGLAVLRTGSISWAIGFHAAWNWTMQTALGARGSGYVFLGSPFEFRAGGPSWLSGGSVGMEGSVFCLGLLAAVAAGHASSGAQKTRQVFSA